MALEHPLYFLDLSLPEFFLFLWPKVFWKDVIHKLQRRYHRQTKLPNIISRNASNTLKTFGNTCNCPRKLFWRKCCVKGCKVIYFCLINKLSEGTGMTYINRLSAIICVRWALWIFKPPPPLPSFRHPHVCLGGGGTQKDFGMVLWQTQANNLWLRKAERKHHFIPYILSNNSLSLSVALLTYRSISLILVTKLLKNIKESFTSYPNATMYTN
jgi:hypothetical protein